MLLSPLRSPIRVHWDFLFFMHPLFEGGQTPSPTALESVWKSPYSHYDQLKFGIGLGALQRENNLTNLKQVFAYGISSRFTDEQQGLLLKTYDLAMHLHADQPPRRNGAPVGSHLAKVAIMGLQNKNLNILSVAVRLLHDAIEDGMTTHEQLTTELENIGYTFDAALAISDGASALSVIHEGHKLSPRAYGRRILEMDRNRPYLFLVETKKDDRASNTNDDIVMIVDHPSQANFPRIKDYRLGKAQRAYSLGGKKSRGTESAKRLRDAIATCARVAGEMDASQQIPPQRPGETVIFNRVA